MSAIIPPSSGSYAPSPLGSPSPNEQAVKLLEQLLIDYKIDKQTGTNVDEEEIQSIIQKLQGLATQMGPPAGSALQDILDRLHGSNIPSEAVKAKIWEWITGYGNG
jgi:hypothetical protein